MKKTSKFYTSEYYLAVTLAALRESLTDIERDPNSQRATFVFKESATIHKNVDDFRAGKILIEPQALFMQHKNLKSMLYNK